MSNVTITNLPSVTNLSGSSQLQVVQSGTSYRATAQQIADLNANAGTVTSITAQNPLSGGTITTTGTIGLNNNGVTNTYLAQMNANTIKGNATAGSAQPQDLTAAQVRTLLGTGTITSLTAGTGLTTLSTNPLTTSGTILIDVTGVTSGTYGTAAAVPQITINSQGQITTASSVNISIPSGQVTGLGTMATQNANAVAITGGTLNGTIIGGTTPAAATFTSLTATGNANLNTITAGTWNGTPIAVTYGGTGATTASGARTNLGAAASGANSDITSLTGLTTPLAETEGGTGYGSYTTGDILYASSSTTLARLNDVATGNALISGGVGVAPSYGKIGLTTHVSGTLPVANGGTGATTLTGYLVGNGTSAVTAVSTIPNAGLTNSSITIGSTSVALGASTTTLAGLTTVTVTQDPTTSLELSTKQYVDNQVATVSNTTFHAASAAATTANLTATYNNGTAGVGATLTNSGVQAAFAVDGYTASLNDRILVKDQTTGAQNGIYTVTTVGTILTNWVLTRATDFNTVGTGPNYIETGASTFVNGGTTYGSTSWVMNTTGTITVGSTSLVWVQTSSSGNITVTAPITKTGNTIGLGTVGVANGGTGLTSLTSYAVLYAASTSSVGQISPSTTGYPLLSTGASTAPAFSQLSLTAGVTGTLPVANGGTGTATAFTTGSVVFAGASGVYTQDNAHLFWDDTNNRLGVNTATPQTQLTIVSNTQTTTPTATLPAGTDLYIVGANAANTRITQDAYGTGSYGVFTARSARGTAASPTASQSTDILAQFTGRGYGATVFATASTGRFDITAAENFTDTAQGTYASVFTTAIGSNSPTEAFRFGPAGQFGIGAGTYGTSGYVLTSGGASAAPTWSQVSASSLSGTVPVANGGTGLTTYAVGDLLYASGTTTLSRLADVATGNALISGGVGVAPSWGQISLTTTVTGTLPAANGGTGQASYTIGDLLYASGTTALSRLSDVATGSVLVSGGTSTAPAWSSSPTVTTINYTTAIGVTSQTVPLIIGGTAAASTLTLQSTSGVGTTDSILFKVGNAGATTAMTISTAGLVTANNFGSSSSAITGGSINGTTVGASTASTGAFTTLSGSTSTTSPLYIGGTTASSTLTLESTSGAGTTDNIIFKTGSQSERMRIDTSGNVGIGTTPSSTGGRLQVTAAVNNASAQIAGNANGMSVLNQNGLTIYTNLSGGSTDTTLVAGSTSTTYMAFGIHNGTSYSERMRIDSSGNVSIGSSGTTTGVNLITNANITGATTAYAHLNSGVVQSAVTSAAYPYYSSVSLAASVTTSSLYHHYVNPAAGGATSTITNHVGYFAESTIGTQGAATVSNAFGFYGNIASGTNKWNLYMAGTASNYMAGALGVGTTSVGAAGTITTSGTISDSIGNVRTIVQNSQTTAYVLVATDNGKFISITTGGVTVPASIFSAGQNIVIFNNSGSSQTITQGTSVTMTLAGSATTGNRTLAQYGVATVLCTGSNTFVITGQGLT